MCRRLMQSNTPAVRELIPDVSLKGMRAALWALLPLWIVWVGMSLFYDDGLAAALTIENGFQNPHGACYGFAATLLLYTAVPQLLRRRTVSFRVVAVAALAVGASSWPAKK